MNKEIKYIFDEGTILEEIKRYIDATYDQHYSISKFQATEYIKDVGYIEGFTIGNVLKYASRYGKKTENPDEWRKDLMKVIHYAIIAISAHDEKYPKLKIPNGPLGTPGQIGPKGEVNTSGYINPTKIDAADWTGFPQTKPDWTFFGDDR